MPTYVYRREDGSTFEIEQRITEDALTVCPETGQSVTRVITGSAGLIFKGSGFYLTDYARKKTNAGASKTDGEGSASSSTEGSGGKGSSTKETSSNETSSKGSSDTKAA